MCAYVCVCMRVCECKRERRREKGIYLNVHKDVCMHSVCILRYQYAFVHQCLGVCVCGVCTRVCVPSNPVCVSRDREALKLVRDVA